jgi:hypothetical protein
MWRWWLRNPISHFAGAGATGSATARSATAPSVIAFGFDLMAAQLFAGDCEL